MTEKRPPVRAGRPVADHGDFRQRSRGDRNRSPSRWGQWGGSAWMSRQPSQPHSSRQSWFLVGKQDACGDGVRLCHPCLSRAQVSAPSAAPPAVPGPPFHSWACLTSGGTQGRSGHEGEKTLGAFCAVIAQKPQQIAALLCPCCLQRQTLGRPAAPRQG